MLDKFSGKFVSVSTYMCIPLGITLSRSYKLYYTFTTLYLTPTHAPLRQAPRPSPGPHKLRECIPLVVFLRNRLKYALTGDEVKRIVKQRLIKVDAKVRTDPNFPAGFMGEFYLSVSFCCCCS